MPKMDRDDFVVEVVLRVVAAHLANRMGDLPKAREEMKTLLPALRLAADSAADVVFPKGAYGPKG